MGVDWLMKLTNNLVRMDSGSGSGSGSGSCIIF